MKKALNTGVAIGLSLFFMVVVLVLMLAVMEIQDADNAVGAFIFVIFMFIVLLAVFGFGRQISEKMGIEMYTVLCMTTSLYVVLGTVLNCALADSVSGGVFFLINLALLFVYFIVSFPLYVTGVNAAGDREIADPGNPHNMPDLYALGRVNNLPSQPQPNYNQQADRNMPDLNALGGVNGMQRQYTQPQYNNRPQYQQPAPQQQYYAQPQGQPMQQQYAQPAQQQYAQPQYQQPAPQQYQQPVQQQYQQPQQGQPVQQQYNNNNSNF